MSFIDQYGLVHCNPDEISENGPIFTAYYYILKMLAGHTTEPDTINNILNALYEPIEKRWKDRGGEAGYHVSHDNILGIYALREIANLHVHVGGLEVQKTEPKFFSHPRDRIFFGLMEGKAWAHTLFPILLVIMIVSFLRPKEVTSGKLLNFARIHSLAHKFKSYRFLINLANFFINRTYGQGGWKEVFSIYFKHIDHPCNILARELF